MVTDGRYKLVWNLSDLCELYDLARDPHELRNVFYDDADRDARDHDVDLLQAEARRLVDVDLRFHRPEVQTSLDDSIAGPLRLPGDF